MSPSSKPESDLPWPENLAGGFHSLCSTVKIRETTLRKDESKSSLIDSLVTPRQTWPKAVTIVDPVYDRLRGFESVVGEWSVRD